MSTRTCKNCTCPCLLVSRNCVVDGANILTQNIPVKDIQASMDAAQARWINDLLGDCYETLCAALDASELEVDPVDLEEKWQNLIDLYIAPLMIQATALEYLSIYGFDKLRPDWELEMQKDYLATLEMKVVALTEKLKIVLMTDTYGCYTVEDECLEAYTLDADWVGVSKYPEILSEENSYGVNVCCCGTTGCGGYCCS